MQEFFVLLADRETEAQIKLPPRDSTVSLVYLITKLNFFSPHNGKNHFDLKIA